MKDLSPIVLFCYNRPWHTQQTLDALSKNDLAIASELFIYCDGPKNNSDEATLRAIGETRFVVKNEKRFKSVNIIESKVNKGLANSIIDGVTEIVNRYGKIIVLEDDLITSTGFLNYMNDALDLYVHEPKVGCIHGWNYDLNWTNNGNSTFFLKGADCWGWATWKDSWTLFNKDGESLYETIKSENSQYLFDRNGTHQYFSMLEDQINGKIDSWAIRWHASLFLKNKLCLQPTFSLVHNIGLDDSGTHCSSKNEINQKTVESISLSKIDLIENTDFFIQFRKSKADVKLKEHNMKKTIEDLGFRDLFYIIRKKIFNSLKKKEKIIKKVEKVNENIWIGDYNSWEEAYSDCTGYDSEIILEKCKQALLKVKDGEYAYERDSVLFSKIEYNWELLTSILLSAKDNKINVIDFGGSLGSTYFQHRSFFKNNHLDVSWSVVEQVDFVNCGNENFKDEFLHFYFKIEDVLKKNKSNFIILSSVLPYLKDPHGILDLIIKNKIEYIFIDKTLMFEDEKEIITKQIVPDFIYKAQYPCWVLDYNNVKINILESYDLIFEFTPYNGKTAIMNNQVANFYGVLFKIKG